MDDDNNNDKEKMCLSSSIPDQLQVCKRKPVITINWLVTTNQ